MPPKSEKRRSSSQDPLNLDTDYVVEGETAEALPMDVDTSDDQAAEAAGSKSPPRKARRTSLEQDSAGQVAAKAGSQSPRTSPRKLQPPPQGYFPKQDKKLKSRQIFQNLMSAKGAGPFMGLDLPPQRGLFEKMDSESAFADEAAIVLAENPSIVSLIFGQKLDRELSTIETIKGRKDFFKSVIIKSFGDNKSRLILMAKAFIDALPEEKVTGLDPKEKGHNLGFYAQTESDRAYFVKSFLDSSASGKKQIFEFLTYKILEHLGYGPKCTDCHYKDTVVALFTRDLSDRKMKDAGMRVKEFKTSEFYAGEPFPPGHEVIADQTDSFIFSAELITRFLRLGDVTKNLGNTGFTVTSIENEGEKRIVKIKAKILDFHFDPLLHDYELNATDLDVKSLSLDSIHRAMSKIAGEDGAYRLSAALPFASKIQSEKIQDSYIAAMDYLMNGYRKRPSLKDAIGMACENSLVLADKMKGTALESEFSAGDILKYKDLLMTKVEKLGDLYQSELKAKAAAAEKSH